MAIGILAGTQGGEVELLDEGETSSAVILQQPTGVAQRSRGAIVPLSGEPAPVPPEGGARVGVQPPDRVWVTLGIRAPFRLKLDTSALPAGPLFFDESRFIDRALQEADLSGAVADHPTEITPGNAHEWGLTLGTGLESEA